MTRALCFVSLSILAGCSCSDPGDNDAGMIGIDGGDVDGGGGTDAGRVDAGRVDAGMTSDAGPVTGECMPPLLRCGTECVDVSSSAAHCGGCDQACAAPAMCASGVCGNGTAMCPPGYVLCTGGGGGGECRDISGDPEFCGACDVVTACAADEFCSDGACVCRPGLSDCDGACVDTDTDPDHCGSCGNGCMGATDTCVGGTCSMESACAAPLEVCDGACVDTETSTAHCGACGDACDVDQVCIGGNCEDYEPAVDCTSCPCDTCPADEPCCDLPGYGLSCVAACPT